MLFGTRAAATSVIMLALALPGGCDFSQLSTAQGSNGTSPDVLNTLGQGFVNGLATGLGNLGQVLLLRLFA